MTNNDNLWCFDKEKLKTYKIAQPPKIVGYWWIAGSPQTGYGTKFAVYHADKTPEQIKTMEETFGWIWEEENDKL